MFVNNPVHFAAMKASSLKQGALVKDTAKNVTFKVDKILSTMTYPPTTVITGPIPSTNKTHSFACVIGPDNIIKGLDLVG